MSSIENTASMDKKIDILGSLKKLTSGYLTKLIIVCIVISIGISFVTPYFLTFANFRDMLLGTSVIGIIAFGMTIVLISDGIDLSVGSVVAFSSVVMCVSINAGLGLGVALILTMGSAMLIGAVNGFFIAVLNINPFIITLGTMSVVRGLSFIVIGGRALPFSQPAVRYIGSQSILGIPIPIYFMIIVFAVLWFMLKYTQLGRNIYAIGNNTETARLSGINIIKTKMLVFVIMGLLAGVAGFLLSAQTYAGSPNAGIGYELDAITAAILGGTSLSGGQGKVVGTVIGIIIVALVLNGQNMIGISYDAQYVSKGVIILIAMTIARKRA